MRILFHRLLLTRPNKPKNPLLKIVFAIFGLILLLGACALALVAGAFMIMIGFVLKLVGNKPKRSPASSDVIDAEYSVVEKSTLSLTR
jgi:hypothetical protein